MIHTNAMSTWINLEFLNVDFRDKRLDERFKKISIGLGEQSEKNISSSFDSWKEILIILGHSAEGFIANLLSNLWDKNLPKIDFIISLAGIHDLKMAKKLKIGNFFYARNV